MINRLNGLQRRSAFGPRAEQHSAAVGGERSFEMADHKDRNALA
jgi:hypothetical protein